MEARAYDALIEKRGRCAERIGDLLGANTWGAYARMGETLALFDASGCRRFLMAGCGPVPDSLFHLDDWTEIPELVGVDREPEAVRRARRLVEAFGRGRIRIDEADAATLDYAGFDVICCSAFLAPRRAIMERIAATSDDGAVVILRDPVATGTLLFESVAGALPSRFAIRTRSSGPPGRFMLAYYVLDVRPVRA
jgi:SAM-dependent methyltransferase